MRRQGTAAAVLLAALGLAGCGKKDAPTVADSSPPPSPTDTPVVPAADPKVPTAPAPMIPADKKPADPPAPIPPFVVYGQTPPKGADPMPAAPPAPVAVPAPGAQPPLPPPPPVTKPPEPKEKVVGSVKIVEWPREINGRALGDYIKDVTDPDPATRERALRTLPNFGPEIVRREAASARAILGRMDGSREMDPGVRAAAFEAAGAVGFEKDDDTKEAVRILFVAADAQTARGGATRLHAVQTLAAFGPKAEGAVSYLVGQSAKDSAYETRRSVANTLGQIGTNEYSGPNPLALGCLANMISDHSAPVRLEAMQSLITLGPPFLPRPPGGPLLRDVKNPADVPKVDEKTVAGYVALLKKRLAPDRKADKSATTGLVERDKQVEIYARLALMRLDPREVNDDNLNAITKYITGPETAPKLHALTVLGMIGESGAKRIDDVVKALGQEDPLVVSTAVNALVSMGVGAKPALPALEKLKDRPLVSKEKDDREKEKKYWAELSETAVKLIKEAKPPGLAPAPAEARRP